MAENFIEELNLEELTELKKRIENRISNLIDEQERDASEKFYQAWYDMSALGMLIKIKEQDITLKYGDVIYPEYIYIDSKRRK